MFEKTIFFLKNNFHSLFHRNYRYFFFGQLISLIGTWMQVMAQAWLVYTITGSPFKLGFVGTVQFLPIMVFSLFTGVFVDRFQKRKILIFTQVMSMLQAFALFTLIYFGHVQYWHILVLAFILGCTNSIDMPARQSYIMELVGRKDVVNAIGLNSAIFNIARIVGPAIAAILMTGIGISWCFLINGFSFICVIIALLGIKHDPDIEHIVTERSKKMDILKEVKEGLVYIYNNPILLKTSLIVLFIAVISFNYNVLVPVFARTTLGLQEKGFGVLLSSLGVGSLIGALSVATRMKSEPKTKSLVTSSVFLGITLFLLGFCRNIYAASILIAFCGIFNLWFFTNANSLLQLNSSTNYRGRVMSVYSMVFAGTTPIGNFMTGLVAEGFGAAVTFNLIGAIIFIVIISFQTIRGSIKLIDNRSSNLD